ncbi:MAG: DUF975 family protein [Lachnospiraceae bacterium]|nr:DUF975 family protein [Lachnospiraceae bacterium]
MPTDVNMQPEISISMNLKTSSQLKQTARGLLLGKYRAAVSVLLATELMVNILALMAGASSTGYTITGLIFQLIISFVITLFYGILSVGINAFYLNIACGKPYSLSDIFLGFKTCPDKAIGIQFFSQLFTRLPLYCVLAFILYLIHPLLQNGQAALSNDTASITAFSILLIVLLLGALILFFWASLGFSQCFFLLLDYPDRSIKEILGMSWKLMKGHKLRLLYIYISFLPLVLVSYISLGIGLFFIIPYQNMTYTQFYLNLIQYRAAQGGQNSTPTAQYIDYQV